MKFRDFLREETKEIKKTEKLEESKSVIDRIYKQHKKVFDELKDR